MLQCVELVDLLFSQLMCDTVYDEVGHQFIKKQLKCADMC